MWLIQDYEVCFAAISAKEEQIIEEGDDGEVIFLNVYWPKKSFSMYEFHFTCYMHNV